MADASGLIEQGKRALTEGNKSDAQSFLMRATEIDETNVEAWLWLASAVDTPEEMQICLENVLVLDPANAKAKQMLTELEHGEIVKSTGENSVFTTDPDPGSAAQTPAADSDPFGSTFGGTGFMDDSDDDSFGAGGPFSSDFSFTDTPESPPFVAEEASSSPFSEPEAVSSAPTSPPPPEPDTSFDALREDEFADSSTSFSSDEPFASGFDDDYDDDDDTFDYDFDEADSYSDEDPLELLPPDIKPTRLPGTDEEAGVGLPMAVVWVIGVLNVLALAALIVQLVL